MYRSLGSMAHNVLHGKGGHPLAAAISHAPVGMRGTAASRLAGIKALKAAEIKTGKRIVGAGIGLGALGIVNRKQPVGAYNPRRPVMPVPQNGRPM
jgi:hypothetical protein